MLGKINIMKKKIDNIYFKHLSFNNIYNVWSVVKKTCKNRNAIFRFNLNLGTNIFNIYNSLLNKSYRPLPYKLFLIFEPKARLVMSQTVFDKIVNHFVVKYYLIPYLDNKLIDSNVATRKGKGSAYAYKLIENYINEIRIKEPNKEIFCLKVDISKYFYNINHNILIKMLECDIKDGYVIDLIKIIINETNKPYINERISVLNKKFKTDIPYYNEGVGLSIGAMTSQFLAIYYLNNIDHYIKEVLGFKYYIRYMDDFIILDTNKEDLKKAFKILSVKISELNLRVNPKSTITNLSNGISFLGYKYKVVNNKFKIYYNKKTIKKINRKLANLKKYDLLKYYLSFGSYYGYLGKIIKFNKCFKMNLEEKYKYYKSINLDSIIFMKIKNKYIIYGNDTLIIKNNTIKLSIKNSIRIFNYLNINNIKYIII